MENISIEELKNLKNINLIDIRNREKYNNNHIPDAKNILLEELLIRPEKYLSKVEKYYIYCQRGIQSRKLCQILLNQGFVVANVVGGYEAWILNN